MHHNHYGKRLGRDAFESCVMGGTPSILTQLLRHTTADPDDEAAAKSVRDPGGDRVRLHGVGRPFPRRHSDSQQAPDATRFRVSARVTVVW